MTRPGPRWRRRPARAGTVDASPVVLGLCSFTHDSSAALVVDGQLVGLVEEERLCGVKHTKVFPALSVDWLLDQADLTSSDIDIVAYNFDGRRYLDAVGRSLRDLRRESMRTTLDRARGFSAVYRNYRRRMQLLQERFPQARIEPVLHHRAHGLYAFAGSGHDRAAVLIVDSLGETQTTTIGLGHRNGNDSHQADGSGDGAGGGRFAEPVDGRGNLELTYDIRHAIHDPASLGYVYGAVTQHLGWRRGDEEGTVMALAALGDPTRFRDLFNDALVLTDDGFGVNPSWFPPRTLLPARPRVTAEFIRATCPPRTGESPVMAVHADLAAALQERTEQVLLHLALLAKTLTGAPALVLGGGVAANCLGAGRIAASGLFEQVSVPPAPGDSGTAIGAAASAYLAATSVAPDGISGRCYLGPAYDDADIAAVLNGRGRQVADPAGFAAERLAAGDIIGLFQGGLEAGPRALGNRSILASPLRPDVVTRLNATVKYREEFRPFAPVVLAEDAARYFDLPHPSPFMSLAVPVTELARQQIPAVVHDNGTARVQTVAGRQNPLLEQILHRFAERTGVPVLINTSLNVKGQPIAGTPQMALACLQESGLDGLLMQGGWWVPR